MTGKERECRAQYEHPKESGFVPAKENGDGKEACQRKTPDDVCGP
jgi:hypothetical protein